MYLYTLKCWESCFVAGSSVCAPYSASYTYYAQQNYASCSVRVCGGETVVASGCSSQGGSCSGNQYLRLQAPGSGWWLAAGGYGYCGSCAQTSYSVPSGSACQNYTIAQGCEYIYSCSGRTAVKILSVAAAAQGEVATSFTSCDRLCVMSAHRTKSQKRLLRLIINLLLIEPA